jgi:hypothetical protein
MIIQVNSSLTDNRNLANAPACSENELKDKFNQLFANEPESKCNVNWLEDGTVELQGASPMSLHNFTLQAESMGKSVKYHKKTIIEIV